MDYIKKRQFFNYLNINVPSWEINSKYVFVVYEQDGILKFRKEEIQGVDETLINKIFEMSETDTSVFDLQNYYAKRIQSSRYYNYCWPFGYLDSFVEGAFPPKSEEELRHLLKDKEETCVEEYKQKLKNGDDEYFMEKYASSENLFESQEKYVKERLDEYKRVLKLEFVFDAIRYIYAIGYEKKIKELKDDKTVMMISSDDLGWTEYKYKVSDYIVITLKSNFGYGRSSYFYVNITYKGVDIVPFSALVRYFYANMDDLVRYTRAYNRRRDSWYDALKFVSEISNFAAANEKAFVQEWIINEIEQMMIDLRKIFKEPSGILDQLIKKNRPVNNLLYVRSINGDERNDYKTCPSEFLMAFKAEKVSGALLFLDKLSAMSSIYSEVVMYIEEIVSMCEKLLLEIDPMIQKISEVVEQRENELGDVEAELEDVSEELDSYRKKLDEMLDGLDDKEQKIVSAQFSKANPLFVELQENRMKLFGKIQEKQKDIKLRKNFIDTLMRCKERINDNTNMKNIDTIKKQ